MTKIVGYFAIFLGALWVLWPQLLRGWAAGKANRTLFWALFFSFFFPLAAWAGKAGLNGWLTALAVFVALGVVLRTAIRAAAARVPLLYFRVAGAVNIVSGLSLVFLRK